MPPTSDDETIAIYSDYVCPFCYLGRESLRQYQTTRADSLQIDWQPFDLRAGQRTDEGKLDESVDDGKDDAYYEQARKNVERLQEEYGVEMDLDLAMDVDSLNAQLASLYVKREYPDQWLPFDEAIFEALWQEGRDIGDPDVLADLAETVGLDGDEIRTAIDDEPLYEDLQEAFEAARVHGVSGVPTFVYDDHVARGAVPPEHLERLVEGV